MRTGALSHTTHSDISPLAVMDSMSGAELDSDGRIFIRYDIHGPDPTVIMGPNKRVERVARGSGTSVSEVEELLQQHKVSHSCGVSSSTDIDHSSLDDG